MYEDRLMLSTYEHMNQLVACDPMAEEGNARITPHLFLSHAVPYQDEQTGFKCDKDGPHNSSSCGNIEDADLYFLVPVL